jgi:hypothetical protein
MLLVVGMGVEERGSGSLNQLPGLFHFAPTHMPCMLSFLSMSRTVRESGSGLRGEGGYCGPLAIESAGGSFADVSSGCIHCVWHVWGGFVRTLLVIFAAVCMGVGARGQGVKEGGKGTHGEWQLRCV